MDYTQIGTGVSRSRFDEQHEEYHFRYMGPPTKNHLKWSFKDKGVYYDNNVCSSCADGYSLAGCSSGQYCKPNKCNCRTQSVHPYHYGTGVSDYNTYSSYYTASGIPGDPRMREAVINSDYMYRATRNCNSYGTTFYHWGHSSSGFNRSESSWSYAYYNNPDIIPGATCPNEGDNHCVDCFKGFKFNSGTNKCEVDFENLHPDLQCTGWFLFNDKMRVM